MFHNITARGKYTLDGYDIMSFNQNLYGENVLYFYLRNHTQYVVTSHRKARLHVGNHVGSTGADGVLTVVAAVAFLVTV